MADITTGTRVRRIDKSTKPREGTIVDVAERQGRACASQRQKVALRIQVRWDGDPSNTTHPSVRDGQTSWLEVSAEGKRWERLP